MYVPVYMCVFKFFSETTGPMKPKCMWNKNRIDSNDSGHSIDSGHLLFFTIVGPREGGAFSRDFTIILAPECRAFSGALKIEKLKALLIPGPKRAVDTNDWCIIPTAVYYPQDKILIRCKCNDCISIRD